MFAGAIVGPINHLLRGESWATGRLAPFAGKTARFKLPPFEVSLTVTEAGELAAAAPDAAPEASFSLTPGLLLRILAADEKTCREVETTGEAAFAAEVLYVAQNLRWDAEEDLSHLVGDILAHRMVQAGARLSNWRAQAMSSLAHNFAEYWTEEQPLLAGGRELRAFAQEVDALCGGVRRLEKNIERIARADQGKH